MTVIYTSEYMKEKIVLENVMLIQQVKYGILIYYNNDYRQRDFLINETEFIVIAEETK
jgi:hypothetical protein